MTVKGGRPPAGWMRLAVMVARSSRRVARLCTGPPPGVALVAALASAAGERWAGATVAPQLAPAVRRIHRRAQRVPRTVTADRGYGEPAVERDLQALAVHTIAIPRKAKPSPPAKPSSISAASAATSSGAPDRKGASATSNAATAGTVPTWTASKEPRSGADTAPSPTTWSDGHTFGPAAAGMGLRTRRAIHRAIPPLGALARGLGGLLGRPPCGRGHS